MSVAEVLRSAGMAPVRKGMPLPFEPAGSVMVNPSVHMVERDEGGAVFIWGMAAWCWEAGDVVGRRLAAVQLTETKAATPTEVAAAFGVDFGTLTEWRQRWSGAGAEGLMPKKSGPKGPSKLTEEVAERARQLYGTGKGLRAVARELGLDPSTVRRALPPRPAPAPQPCGALVPLAQPLPRTTERDLARAGLLTGAEPVV
jgi:transposase-like protein